MSGASSLGNDSRGRLCCTVCLRQNCQPRGASWQEGATCEQMSCELCCLQDDTVQVGVSGESKHRAGCIQQRWGAVQKVKDSWTP